jgi:branched-chain amino acid transport system ATP-binding protein
VPLLSVTNLEVCYGVISAIQDVSLHIEPGEIVTLIGSNGAGKTTLLRTISGLIKPVRGDMKWTPADGEAVELRGMRPDQIVCRGISHVPEGRQVFPAHTVRENLLLGAYQQRDSARMAADLDHVYSLFPVLSERRTQKAGTLSGGEQQMLAIGRALMARPKLLLLDEPSLGLAPLIVRKIFEIIRSINAKGTTIFLVEQNAHMALAVANRGYVLQTGRVLLADAASALLQHPDVKKAYLGG